MTPRHTQFDAAIARAAEETLEGLTEVQRVHFALKLMLDVTSPDAVPALNWAAGRVLSQSFPPIFLCVELYHKFSENVIGRKS